MFWLYFGVGKGIGGYDWWKGFVEIVIGEEGGWGWGFKGNVR